MIDVYCSYELEGADDLVGSGIGCVVRTDPDSAALRSDQLECRAVNWQQNRYKLAGHEEQVSAMICLRPANYARVVFDVSTLKSVCCTVALIRSYKLVIFY